MLRCLLWDTELIESIAKLNLKLNIVSIGLEIIVWFSLVWFIWNCLSTKYINNILSRRFLQWRQFYDWTNHSTKLLYSTAHVELWRSILSEYPDNLSASKCAATYVDFWWMVSNYAMQNGHTFFSLFKWNDTYVSI